MQEEIERLTDELSKIQEISELEKQTNVQLEIQIAELKEKLKDKKIQMELETSVEIAELNKIIKELQVKLRDMESGYLKKIEESQIENEKLNQTLDIERNKVQKYESQKHDYVSSQRIIEELMQQISGLEKEKSELANQYEKYATVSDEVMTYKKQMNEISASLETCEQDLERERADRESIEHSQEELLRKMKELQRENDELVIRLEGLKTENEGLIDKNRNLEDRIKILEDQNKLHLHQVNETLKMPVPIIRDHETILAASSEEVEKLHEIRDQFFKRKSLESADYSPRPPLSKTNTNSSIHLSSSSLKLTVPSVNLDSEKRPATPEKELKIIPKIVEPTTSDALPQNENYDSTFNSQDVPTIPNDDSPNRKAFAEMFSQSSKMINFVFGQNKLMIIFF